MGKKKSSTQKLPFVSVICVTYNRRPFFPTFFECLKHQDYPVSRYEVLIVDDGTDSVRDLVEASGLPNIQYFAVAEKMPLGKKRNYSHTLIDERTRYLAYFDDDDFHHPQRLSHSVAMLEAHPAAMCAGSSELYVYFKASAKHPSPLMVQFGPYGDTHATAGTFMFRRELLATSRYEDTACLAEEKHFLKQYTVPFVQLDPMKTILCFSHEHNTFDKRTLLVHLHPQSKCCKPSSKTVEDFVTDVAIRRFFLEEIDPLLAMYDPGLPKHKPDVLKQLKQIEAQLAAPPATPQQVLMERPGLPPVVLTPQDCVNIIRQQKELIDRLLQRVRELEAPGIPKGTP